MYFTDMYQITITKKDGIAYFSAIERSALTAVSELSFERKN